MKPMTATLISASGNRKVWKVENPSTIRKQGGTWRAVSCHGSDNVALFTWVRKKPVATRQADKLMPRVIQAIVVAELKGAALPNRAVWDKT